MTAREQGLDLIEIATQAEHGDHGNIKGRVVGGVHANRAKQHDGRKHVVVGNG